MWWTAHRPASCRSGGLAVDRLHALSTPLGQPAPFMHCHTDDTTIHAASPADAGAILAGSISLHCQAVGARMQTAKSTGMGIGCLQHLTGPDADEASISPFRSDLKRLRRFDNRCHVIAHFLSRLRLKPASNIRLHLLVCNFPEVCLRPSRRAFHRLSAAGSAITHLGIPLSTDPDAAARALYTAILQRLDRRIARWSGFRLSLLGRAHVAKQVLVSMFTYHGTLVPVPADILRQLCTSVYTFVAANRPAAAGAAHLFPSRAISARTLYANGSRSNDARLYSTVVRRPETPSIQSFDVTCCLRVHSVARRGNCWGAEGVARQGRSCRTDG